MIDNEQFPLLYEAHTLQNPPFLHSPYEHSPTVNNDPTEFKKDCSVEKGDITRFEIFH